MHILSRKQLKVITFDSLNWLWPHLNDFLMHHRIISFTVCSGVKKKKKLLHKVKEMCIVAVVAPSDDSLWGQRSSVQAGGKKSAVSALSHSNPAKTHISTATEVGEGKNVTAQLWTVWFKCLSKRSLWTGIL